ncbi:MAG TPA: hypothetical protein VFW65_18965 [Pseudonocardiaceae bacterium]|nr:hypothetical protein [Pseudonocardiaceae bacterium]
MHTVRRRLLAPAAILLIVLAAVLGLVLATSPSHATTTAAAAAPARSAVWFDHYDRDILGAPAAVDPMDMTDAQLAAALDASCDQRPHTCLLHPTTANVGTRWVPWVCAQVAQLDPPAGNSAWQAAWPKIGPLVVATGRCSEPSTSQLARELAALPGASRKVMDPASLEQVIEQACPEIAAHTGMPNVSAAGVLRIVKASGRCSR